MIKNYIKIAWRNLYRHKTFNLIHIIGLGLAFGAASLLFLTADFELSFDNFHHRSEDIYQTYFESYANNGSETDAAMPVPLAELAKDEIPAIEAISRYGNKTAVYRVGDKQFSFSTRYVDPAFFDIFNFQNLDGDISSLEHAGNLVISHRTAKALFGKSRAIGKTLEINRGNGWEQAIVGAVIQDAPRNSSIDPSVLIRFQDYPNYKQLQNSWEDFNHSVFVRLHSGTSPDTFAKQAKLFNEKYLKEDIDKLKRDGAKADENGAYLALRLLPLRDIHFSNIGIGDGPSPFFPWMLVIISILILFIASSNFVNLSLASSFNRAREIGMRKTLGAWTYQLIAQLWGETLLISLIALSFGLFLAITFLSPYNALMGYDLHAGDLFSWINSLMLIGSFLLVTALAGGYPAWVMARFNTLSILKGKLNFHAGNYIRKVFTVGQFAIASILITITFIVGKQIDYIQHKSLGYNQAEVISIPIGKAISADLAIQRMRAELANLPEIESLSASYINMGKGNDGTESRSTSSFDYEGREVYTHKRRVDYDYLKTLGLQLVEGRDFSRNFSTDTTAVIINEKMAAQLGGKDLVGKTLPLYRDDTKIIGIVKDFNFENLHENIEPMTLHMNAEQGDFRYIFVRVNPTNLSASMAMVTEVWKRINPKSTDMPSFLHENINRTYSKEKQFSRIVVSGSLLATIIACLGLFALALLMTNQRRKEITVRKILGSHIHQLVFLLSKDFIKLISAGFIIATPISWWIMNKWLDNFAYRINLKVGEFVYAGALILLVALITVFFQSLRAAIVNPAKTLREE